MTNLLNPTFLREKNPAKGEYLIGNLLNYPEQTYHIAKFPTLRLKADICQLRPEELTDPLYLGWVDFVYGRSQGVFLIIS